MPFVKGQARPAGAGRRRRPAAPQLAIVYRPLAWFRPYERNPRKNDGAVDRMCASIRGVRLYDPGTRALDRRRDRRPSAAESGAETKEVHRTAGYSLRWLERGAGELSKKAGTMIMKGGNTDELYKGNGRLEMAKSLQQQHPDVVTVVKKFNRWQHQVDYRPFRSNRFILRPGFAAPAEMNEYGMRFEYTADAALREAAAV